MKVTAIMEFVEDQDFIYIRPGRQRFKSLQQALQYAQNNMLRNHLIAEIQALQTDNFGHNSNIYGQFTSNYEDYMYRGCLEMSWFGSFEIK